MFGFELFPFWVPGGKTIQTIILHINGVICSTQSEHKSDRLRISLILDTGRKNPKNNHFSHKRCAIAHGHGLKMFSFELVSFWILESKNQKMTIFDINGVLQHSIGVRKCSVLNYSHFGYQEEKPYKLSFFT